MSDIGTDKGFPRVPGSEPSRGDVDPPTGVSTTGHSWDGIEELNNPMPRWWLWVFYATHVFALVYILLYPAIPLWRDSTTGLLGWNSRLEVAQDIQLASDGRADLVQRVRELPLQEIVADNDMRQFAFRGGESAFRINCVQCHGADAAGSVGYPNLNDDDWIWGGTLEDIHYTISHGIRFAGDDMTRFSEMPAYGRDGILNREEIAAVADHVLSLSGRAAENPQGAEIYAQQCAACHMPAGEGEPMLGAPRLSDEVFLFGSSPAAVRAQISNPRHGSMPAWAQRLDEATIKQLTVYVHSLGGGETVVETQ